MMRCMAGGGQGRTAALALVAAAGVSLAAAGPSPAAALPEVLDLPAQATTRVDGGYASDLAPAGDVNGDGVDDVIVGLPSRGGSLDRNARGGAAVVFGGAAWSAVRLLRRGGPRRLAAGNAVIAAGTLILSASGLLNSVLGEMEAFAVTLAVGVTILFVGFLVATASPAEPPTRRKALSAGSSPATAASAAAPSRPSRSGSRP